MYSELERSWIQCWQEALDDCLYLEVSMFSSLKLLQCSITFLGIKQDKGRRFSLMLVVLWLWDSNTRTAVCSSQSLLIYINQYWYQNHYTPHKQLKSLEFHPLGISSHISISPDHSFMTPTPQSSDNFELYQKTHAYKWFPCTLLLPVPAFSILPIYFSWTIASPYVISITCDSLLQASTTSSIEQLWVPATHKVHIPSWSTFLFNIHPADMKLQISVCQCLETAAVWKLKEWLQRKVTH